MYIPSLPAAISFWSVPQASSWVLPMTLSV